MERRGNLFTFFPPMIKLLMTDTASRVKNPRCLYQVWWNAGNQVGDVQRWRGWRSLFPFISLGISFHCWFTAGSANLSHKDRLGTIGWILIPDGASVWCEGLFSLRYAFLWGKKKSNKIVCTSWHLVKFSFFFFLYKKFNSFDTLMINHYFTDNLWKCDPGISSCKVFTAAGENTF